MARSLFKEDDVGTGRERRCYLILLEHYLSSANFQRCLIEIKTFLFLASYDISKIDPDQDHKIEDKLQGVVVADNGTVLIADYSEHPIIKGKML